MARVAFLALVLVVLCFGFAAADEDICDEAQFWKSLVTHKVSAAQLTSCHEVVSIVTFARESRCMQLVPATVCSFAQKYCPGIECSVQFTLADDLENDEEPQDIEAEAVDADIDTEAFEEDETEEDIEEDLTDEFKRHDTNQTKKQEKAQKKADKKALKHQKKEQKRAAHEEEKAAHERKKAEEHEAEKAKEEQKQAAHEQKKQQDKADRDAKRAAHEQKKIEHHQREAAKHNNTAHHHHRKANGTKPVSALADWEVIDAEEVEDIVALDTETMTTNRVPQRGPRPAPVVLILGIMMVGIAVVALTALRQKARREGYRTLPDSGYL